MHQVRQRHYSLEYILLFSVLITAKLYRLDFLLHQTRFSPASVPPTTHFFDFLQAHVHPLYIFILLFILFVSDGYFLHPYSVERLFLYCICCHFGPRVYPKGSLVIALVQVCVRPCVCPSLNISETAHQFFLDFCMKLGHHKGTKVTEPDF